LAPRSLKLRRNQIIGGESIGTAAPRQMFFDVLLKARGQLPPN
jgi:hypothetical protein